MKIILIGANGKIGELVQKALAGAGHEIVKVGRKSGDFRVEIENRESVRKLYQAVGSFDAVAIAASPRMPPCRYLEPPASRPAPSTTTWSTPASTIASRRHTAFVRYSHDGNNTFAPREINSMPSAWETNKNWADSGVFSLISSLRPTAGQRIPLLQYLLEQSQQPAHGGRVSRLSGAGRAARACRRRRRRIRQSDQFAPEPPHPPQYLRRQHDLAARHPSLQVRRRSRIPQRHRNVRAGCARRHHAVLSPGSAPAGAAAHRADPQDLQHAYRRAEPPPEEFRLRHRRHQSAPHLPAQPGRPRPTVPRLLAGHLEATPAPCDQLWDSPGRSKATRSTTI